MFLTIILLFLALIFLIILNNIGPSNVIVNANEIVNGNANEYANEETCNNTHFGCCPDGVNAKINLFGSNCSGYNS